MDPNLVLENASNLDSVAPSTSYSILPTKDKLWFNVQTGKDKKFKDPLVNMLVNKTSLNEQDFVALLKNLNRIYYYGTLIEELEYLSADIDGVSARERLQNDRLGKISLQFLNTIERTTLQMMRRWASAEESVSSVSEHATKRRRLDPDQVETNLEMYAIDDSFLNRLINPYIETIRITNPHTYKHYRIDPFPNLSMEDRALAIALIENRGLMDGKTVDFYAYPNLESKGTTFLYLSPQNALEWIERKRAGLQTPDDLHYRHFNFQGVDYVRRPIVETGNEALERLRTRLEETRTAFYDMKFEDPDLSEDARSIIRKRNTTILQFYNNLRNAPYYVRASNLYAKTLEKMARALYAAMGKELIEYNVYAKPVSQVERMLQEEKQKLEAQVEEALMREIAQIKMFLQLGVPLDTIRTMVSTEAFQRYQSSLS